MDAAFEDIQQESEKQMTANPDTSTCTHSDGSVDGRQKLLRQSGLRHLPEKSAFDRQVVLAVAPVSAWPDGDYYALCEPDYGDLDDDLIGQLARTYNTFLCSLIRNAITTWTPTNRRMLAGLDLRLTGVTPHRLGELAEQRVRSLTLTWMIEHGLFAQPNPAAQEFIEARPGTYKLRTDVVMECAFDGALVFSRDGSVNPEPLAITVVSASLDPAAALEQYAAAAGWFRGGLAANPRCENFLLSVQDSAGLERQIRDDGVVTQHWNLMPLLARPAARDEFFTRLFRSTLRLF